MAILRGMKRLFVTFPGNLARCFGGRMWICHLTMMVVTLVLVQGGVDWWYYRATRSAEVWSWMFPAALVGFFMPMLLPVAMLLEGYIFQNRAVVTGGWALIQAEVAGWLLSATYKAFTGRVHPAHQGMVDISHEFRFGFLRGGVFWGWPSSHTTIAFAMAFTLWTLYPRAVWLRVLAVSYAMYIGVGVSVTIHWLSDFVAGAILGMVIGWVVGRGFKSEIRNPNDEVLGKSEGSGF